MRLDRIDDVPLLSSPVGRGAHARRQHRVCAASALFVCDFSGKITRMLRKATGYGAHNVFLTSTGRIVSQTASTIRMWNARSGALETELEPKLRGYHSLASGRPPRSQDDPEQRDLRGKTAIATFAEKKGLQMLSEGFQARAVCHLLLDLDLARSVRDSSVLGPSPEKRASCIFRKPFSSAIPIG